MVVIKLATYTTRCPFSKGLIKPSNKICLFNQVQFDAFNVFINEELQLLLPPEIIDLIVEKTGYKKLIGRFGFDRYTHWTIKYKKIRHPRINLERFENQIIDSDSNSDNNSNSDDNSDE
jgi:hypothetical protein